jgi:hypothetical protein
VWRVADVECKKLPTSKKLQKGGAMVDEQKTASEGETEAPSATIQIIRLVATNDRGMRIGQYHQRAKYPDEMVDRARELHEDQGLGYGRIAKLLKVSKSLIRDWCRYSRRAQSYVSWKKVKD